MDLLNEIIFQKRNKDYGAYILRKRYNWIVSISLFVAVFIFFLISFYAYIWNEKNMLKFTDDSLNEEVSDYELYNMLKNPDTISFNKPVQKMKTSNNEDKAPVVVDSVKTKIDTLKLVKLPNQIKDSLKNENTSSSDSSRDGSKSGAEEGLIYTKVDELPQFPGGTQALLLFIRQNTHYPEDARKKNISGVVQIEFIITKKGDITKVAVKKGVNTLLDNESIRVVKSFPKWTPGKRKGNSVNVVMVLPFKYSL